jgi:hypothetical protein
MLNEFAEELKQIRESKGLTLQQVAVKTKIDYKFLMAMESGDFEFLPELYVKAFFREYIRMLDLDEQLYTKKYEAAKSGKVYEDDITPPGKTEETHPPDSEVPPLPAPDETPKPKKLSSFDVIRNFKRHEEQSSNSRKRKKAVMYYLTIGTVFFVGLFYLLLFSGEDEIIVPEKPWEEIVEGMKEEFIEEDNIAALTDIVPASDSLHLLIKAMDTSWIRIRIDDSKTEEFILFPSSQKLMKAAVGYRIIVGNARGITVDLNGKPLAFNPKNLSVLRMQVDNNGVKELDHNTIIE